MVMVSLFDFLVWKCLPVTKTHGRGSITSGNTAMMEIWTRMMDVMRDAKLRIIGAAGMNLVNLVPVNLSAETDLLLL